MIAENRKKRYSLKADPMRKGIQQTGISPAYTSWSATFPRGQKLSRRRMSIGENPCFHDPIPVREKEKNRRDNEDLENGKFLGDLRI
jgi:hypothetical protein